MKITNPTKNAPIAKQSPRRAFKKTTATSSPASSSPTDLSDLFQSLKSLLKAYSPPYVSRVDSNRGYELWWDRPFVFNGRKMPTVMFASIVIRASYVGFYFMPIYMNSVLKDKLHPDLAKALKGKACFHIRRNDPSMPRHIRDALKWGGQRLSKLAFGALSAR